MKLPSTLLICLLAAFSLFISCQPSEYTIDMTPSWSDEDTKKAKKVLGSLTYGETTPLDFSDPDHYHFYVRQFINAGISPETNPHLFEEFEKMRQNAQVATKEMSFIPLPVPKTSGTTGLDTINQITAVGTNNGLNWNAAGLSSVPGGTQVTHLVLSLYDSQGNQIGTKSAQQYANGDTLSISSTGSVASDQAVKASLTYFYQAKNGNIGQGVHSLRANSYPVTVINDFPVDSNKLSQDLILICLYRTVSGKCDYWRNESSPWPVQFPIKGSITYSDTIEQPFTTTNSFAYINLVDENGGGGCEYTQINNFFNSATIGQDQKTLSWDISLANFGNACSGNMNPVIYTMYVEVTVKGKAVGYTISSAKNVVPGRNATKLSTMEIAYGCLAAGTEISMADGTLRKIEDVLVGEQVLTRDSASLTVTNTVVGREDQMYRITTEEGMMVMLSDEHPLPTGDGIKLAKELEIGEVIQHQQGTSTISDIELIDFPSEFVFNLYVNTPENDISLDNRLFYANGILVGDNAMQKFYAKQFIVDDDNILEALDSVWLADYKNYRNKMSQAKN